MGEQGTEDAQCQICSRNRVGFGLAATWGMVAGILVLGGMSPSPVLAQALVRNRITTPIRADQMQAVRGTVHPMVGRSQDEGQLNGSTLIQGMSLIFNRSAAQEADLKNLLQEQQTKGSAMYHQWLSPAQFAARYGVSQSDLEKAAAWLQSQDFKIDAIPASADRIDFSGTAAQVNAAFRTQLHRYLLHGKTQWANATELSLPQAIAGMTLGVEHLNTFRPTPHFIKNQVHETRSSTTGLSPHYTLQGQNGSEVNFLAPSDIATIYDVNGLYNNGITGKGQAIAVAGQTDITQYQSDIANFRSLSGLNASNLPTQILVPNTGIKQTYAGDLEEADIDVEWSGAVAKDATIFFVTVGNNNNKSVFDALQYAVQTPLINNTQVVPVISVSYGLCEQGFAQSAGYLQQLENVFEQANAQGQTVIASSGDSGSADCDNTGKNSNGNYVGATQGLAVDYPGSSQYVTAAGGTSFAGDLTDQGTYWNKNNDANNGSALTYIPETTWNNTPNLTALANAGSLSASGGGASTLFSKPSWQVGSGVPQDGKRDVPDISLASDPNHDGYVLCTDETNSSGSLTGTSSCAYPVSGNEVPYFDTKEEGYLYGGTSIAAPQIAAMITLWNQEAGNTNGVGNVNPILYQVAQDAPNAFHDVTTGNNAVVCEQGSPNCISNGSGGYVMSCCNAGSGYDEATGLGSVDVAALGAIWPALTVTTPNPPQPTFSMVPDPITLSLTAGGSATASLVLTPASGFTGTISLACSGLPANTTCNFSPASVNVTAANSNTAQTVTLTVSNSASAQLLSSPQPFHRSWPLETMFAGVFGLSMLGIGRKRRFPSRWTSRWMSVFLLAVGLIAASPITACGSSGSSGSSQTNPGGNSGSSTTYTITVAGKSANTSVTDKILLTIKS